MSDTAIPDAGHVAANCLATVLVAHGARARVRLPDGSEALARAAGRDLQFVCGDEVRCGRDAQHSHGKYSR